MCRGIKHFHIDADIELFDRRFHGIADLLVFLGYQQIDVCDIVGAEIAAHLLALLKIVGEQFAQVLIAVFQRADRTAERRIGVRSVFGDGLGVDGVPCHFADLLVGEWAFSAVVEGEHHFVEADAAVGVDAALLVELVRRRCAQRQCHADFLGFHGADQRIFGSIVIQRYLRCGGFGAPIRVVALQHDLCFRRGFHGERSRSHGLLTVIRLAFLVVDDAGAPAECAQKPWIWLIKGDDYCVFVGIGDFLEIAELVGVHVIVVDDVLQRPDHVRRVEFVTVGEGHVGVERERVGQSVVGNLP